jgi:hypothetical protein
VTNISLLAVTADVFTTQVPVEAFVAHENEPAVEAAQDTTEGFAAVPLAPQLVVVERAVKFDRVFPFKLRPMGALFLTNAASVPPIRNPNELAPSKYMPVFVEAEKE